jgi:membrane dipeptidase
MKMTLTIFKRTVLFTVLSFSTLLSQSVTIGGAVKDSASAVSLDSVRIDIVNIGDPGEHYTVFTNNSGLWSFTFIGTSVGENESTPSSFDLQQNYPNPFNPSTVIPFSVNSPGEVTIAVHNILGQLLHERAFQLSAGQFHVRWNSVGAAGVLFYTIRFGDRSMTRKMVQLDGGFGGGIGEPLLVGGISSSNGLAKRTSANYSVTVSKLGYEPDSIVVPFSSNTNIHFSLTTVHRRAFVIDLHNDVPEKMVGGYQIGIRNVNNQSDIPRFIDGGIDAQMMVLWPSPSAFPTAQYQRTIQMDDTLKAQLSRNAATIAQARSIAEIQSVTASGKIAAVMCVEGGGAIEEDLNKLISLYNRGARYMTITWNNTLSWAVSAADAQSATVGLNDFGRQVVRTMDSLGMIIDVSHTGIKTIEDILAETKNPIIASHSGCRALRNHTRNLTDDQIKAIAAGGGVIGVVFYTSFLSTASASNVNIDTVIKHIDYIKNLVGIDHIGIGSDYDGGITAPVGLENVSKLPNLTMALLRHGYTKSDVRKILGENYLRVFNTVCQ